MCKKTILLLFIYTSISCTSISKLKDIKPQDEFSIKEYLSLKKIKNQNILVVKDFNEYKSLSKKQELEIPKVLFFDKNGNYIEYRDLKHLCSMDPYFFIKNYFKNKDLVINNNITLDSYLSSFIDIETGKPLHIDKKDKIYCFINWAIFTDSLNKESFEILSLNNEDFEYVLVNIDIQKKWYNKN